MQLTGKQIVLKGIVSNYVKESIQQQGLDVRVADIREVGIDERVGLVPAYGATIIPNTYKVEDIEEQNGKDYFYLDPGYYEVELMEGCEIPNNITMYFKTRSSLIRCGAIVQSGQFDAGFKTEKMGCFLDVRLPVCIERGARIAQMICIESYRVDDDMMYDGQWQGDIQRR